VKSFRDIGACTCKANQQINSVNNSKRSFPSLVYELVLFRELVRVRITCLLDTFLISPTELLTNQGAQSLAPFGFQYWLDPNENFLIDN